MLLNDINFSNIYIVQQHIIYQYKDLIKQVVMNFQRLYDLYNNPLKIYFFYLRQDMIKINFNIYFINNTKINHKYNKCQNK